MEMLMSSYGVWRLFLLVRENWASYLRKRQLELDSEEQNTLTYWVLVVPTVWTSCWFAYLYAWS